MPNCENVLLIKYGEIHLKGLNRPYFQRQLMQVVNTALKGLDAQVVKAQSRLYVNGLREEQLQEAIARLRRVFGVHSICPALAAGVSFAAIEEAAARLMKESLAGGGKTSFKVFARRADKSFPMRSDDINRKLGETLLNRFPGLWVDVHNPQKKLRVEVRERAYVYLDEYPGAGGMPVGCNGRAVVLLSGGIDSPVAGYMIAKRGVSLAAVHFYAYPYTSERARDKVVELAKLLSRYTGEIRLHLVPFTEIQMAIYEKCPKNETTVIMRRLMMRIARYVAEEEMALALVTGESIGQVASQTMQSLAVTNDAVTLPIYRPLIGFDKDEIIGLAKKIGTFETSILPYEDCCTIFVPQHPVTKPRVEKIRESEALVDFTKMIETALAQREIV
ncbi:MAG: tRNA 4-thiouridine(8) synthase ThiI [Clostridiales bacterium]|jgi:thiamine biosynthesis protein ThiI|nr:tRNA 4-thiouridine(8) synthase ThiI [Clostridiales bacterium]